MSSKIEIWNKALSHIGVKAFVQSATERSTEASVLNVWWDSSLRYVLADHDWPFALKYATLGLVQSSPNTEWKYAYRYPSDCLKARRIVSDKGRLDGSPPPFATGQDDDGRLIYTDKENAALAYTVLVTETERFDTKFSEALEWYLAAKCAPSLTRMAGISKEAMRMYEFYLARASSKAQNEAQQDEPLDAEHIRARA